MVAVPRREPPKRDTLEVERLLLDRENPRLASVNVTDGSTEQLVRILWREMAVDEVALSIAHNGYYEDEPLLVVPEKTSKKTAKPKYIVVEGNRRLAAVLLLRDSDLRKRIRATELPKLSTRELRALDKLPVLIHPSKESIWAYLGFRHVNGTKPWDAYSKAKYVAHVHESIGVTLDEIARRIGDRHTTVRRLYRGYIVLRQAEQRARFDVEDRVKNRFHFSHLYTAVDYPEVQSFLGINAPRWNLRQPVPPKKLRDLADLMTWLYGKESERIQPVIKTQFPDLGFLRRILGSNSAVALLRRGYSLEQAYDVSRGDKVKFREALSAAKQELQTAKASVTTGYAGEDDLFETMEAVSATAQSVLEEMSTKRVSVAKRKAS